MEFHFKSFKKNLILKFYIFEINDPNQFVFVNLIFINFCKKKVV